MTCHNILVESALTSARNGTITPAQLGERLEKALREPWLEYFNYLPDDAPGKAGSPISLRRLQADPEYDYELLE